MKKVARPDLRPKRDKTLEELEGFVGGDPPYDSYLVRTIDALRKKPIGQFTTEDLRITIGQGRGIPHLLPLALERLEADPLAEGHFYRGDLLMNVLRAEPYWGGDPQIRARMRGVVERALEQLARVESVDWSAGELPDPDQPDEFDREDLEPRLREALGTLE
jgi:contact-dependent growth inhibition (CDI) system CdiI-like immunity protein